MDIVALNVAAIFVVLVLLGIEVWVVAITGLAYLVSREAVTPVTLLQAAVALGASAVGWVMVAMLIGGLGHAAWRLAEIR